VIREPMFSMAKLSGFSTPRPGSAANAGLIDIASKLAAVPILASFFIDISFVKV
jgi:hypothetical protein